MKNFNELIDSVKELDYDEILELNNLTKNYLIEKKREKIYEDHLESQIELNNGNIKFTSDIDDLMNQLDEL